MQKTSNRLAVGAVSGAVAASLFLALTPAPVSGRTGINVLFFEGADEEQRRDFARSCDLTAVPNQVSFVILSHHDLYRDDSDCVEGPEEQLCTVHAVRRTDKACGHLGRIGPSLAITEKQLVAAVLMERATTRKLPARFLRPSIQERFVAETDRGLSMIFTDSRSVYTFPLD